MSRYGLFLTVPRTFNPGDPPPTGYVAWHEWARVQHKSGLRQARCGKCSRWYFPQEMSGERITSTVKDAKGRSHTRTSPVCALCAKERGA